MLLKSKCSKVFFSQCLQLNLILQLCHNSPCSQRSYCSVNQSVITSYSCSQVCKLYKRSVKWSATERTINGDKLEGRGWILTFFTKTSSWFSQFVVFQLRIKHRGDQKKRWAQLYKQLLWREMVTQDVCKIQTFSTAHPVFGLRERDHSSDIWWEMRTNSIILTFLLVLVKVLLWYLNNTQP